MEAVEYRTSGRLIPAPGSAWGPCLECEHQDCDRQRKQAAERCPACREPIGFATLYTRDGGLPHHACCAIPY